MADQSTTGGQLSDQELFQSAVTPDAAPSEPQVTTEAPEPQPAPPAAVEPPVRTPTPESPEVGIPSWRLREEAEARRTAEDRARLLEERLTQIQTHLQQSQKQPDFFENPTQATNALLAQALQPFIEETRRVQEQNRRDSMYNSKLVAEAVHGADKVSEAERAFLIAREKETLDLADYEKVVTAPNRYDEVVKWHRRQSVLSSVGDDPEAWFQQRLQASMADPKFQAEMLEKIRGTAAASPSVVKIPPSLSKATSVAGNSGERFGGSDAELFAYAMKP